jgi:Domain of unknown function (DUF4936)
VTRGVAMTAPELYFYWRANPADSAAVKASVQAWQATLRHGQPGLQTRLLHRSEVAASDMTWMETYALPCGIGPALQQQIAERGDVVTAPWRRGPRHLEVFTEPA